MANAAQAAFCGRAVRALSPERLAAFRVDPSEPAWETLGRYAWNVALCEALYPALHTLEVVLRNSLDTVISRHYPVRHFRDIASWLDAQPPVLNQYGTTAVHDAKKTLLPFDPTAQRFVKPPRPVSPGKLVAELSFGFWSGLLGNYYLYQSRRDPRFWPHLLGEVFPHAPGTVRALRDYREPINRIRQLRNRVFHHEPIWNRPNLAAEYQLMAEVVDWISPELAHLLRVMDRMSEVSSPTTLRVLRANVFRATRTSAGSEPATLAGTGP